MATSTVAKLLSVAYHFMRYFAYAVYDATHPFCSVRVTVGSLTKLLMTDSTGPLS